MHHDHHHHLAQDRLRNALFLTVLILLIEVAAGLAANSLALLSDAGHILTDIFALGLAWMAARLASRPPNEQNTYGYRRGGIIAALINAGLLIVIAAAILVEAFLRLRHPETVNAAWVIPAACGAIVVNAYIAFGLRDERAHNLNVRAAFLHVIGDLAASAGVLVTGIAIALWHANLLDPLLSAAIALLVALGAWRIVRDTIAILMESAPRDVDLEAVRTAMREVPGVEEVHDLHVWALSDGFRLLSAHATVPDQSLADAANLLADLKLLLQRRFHIDHATIELECSDCRVPGRRPIVLHPPERVTALDPTRVSGR